MTGIIQETRNVKLKRFGNDLSILQCSESAFRKLNETLSGEEFTEFKSPTAEKSFLCMYFSAKTKSLHAKLKPNFLDSKIIASFLSTFCCTRQFQ